MYCVNIYSATLNSLQRNFSISASFNVLSFAGSDNLLTHFRQLSCFFLRAREAQHIPNSKRLQASSFAQLFMPFCCTIQEGCKENIH